MKAKKLLKRPKQVLFYEENQQKANVKCSDSLLLKNLLKTNSRLIKSLDLTNAVLF